ncbi:hypothetical protein HHK36_023520 [Tetracentron sinense]|uniref:DOG1 domain-containing protein n=1 Tax=Tetracentron sinense TaxID=13715 RepID=A0A835D5B0_TETSI|nr:hypothetical protein HHK36_023520 [Tetracentron sinense]
MCFHRFYETWLHQLHSLHHQLTSAPKPRTQEDELHLSHLVDKSMTHYYDYYRVKSSASKHNILSILTPTWTTPLERSLQWVAGWRPTTVFHLIYTESSVRFEAQIMDILRGRRTGDLGDLSPSQLGGVSELQCETVREENEITEELSEWQVNVEDLISVCPDMEGKIQRLVKVVEKADDLRLKTIQRVVEILTPQQAVEFLIAAAELQFGVRGWGLDQDRRSRSM